MTKDRVTEVIDAARDLHAVAERYFVGLRVYLGMSRSDVRALRFLVHRHEVGRATTPTELARELGLSNAATTALLDRLEASDHVRRLQDPGDRRRRHVVVQPSAVNLVHDLGTPLDTRLVAAIEGLPPEVLDQAKAVLWALITAADEAADEVVDPAFVLPETRHPEA